MSDQGTATLHLARLTLNREAPDVEPIINLIKEGGNGNSRDEGRSLNVKHRFLYAALPPDKRAPGAFLWREEEPGKFLWLGPKPFEEQHYFKLETKLFAPVLDVGQRLTFTLRANATIARKVLADGSRHDGLRKNSGRPVSGKRVDVVIDAMQRAGIGGDMAKRPKAGHAKSPYLNERDTYATIALKTWLEGQGARNGFTCDELEVDGYRMVEVPRDPPPPRKKGRGFRNDARFAVTDLSGTLTVTDPAAFLAKIASGFGHAKAFGCGLMLIRPAWGA